MHCPLCGHESTRVIDSRSGEAGVRRRRRCDECDERFTTYEQVQRAIIMVVKKDGRREEFDREKLLTGLRVSARKRPLATGSIDAVVDDIERRLLNCGQSEIQSRVIGEMAISHLKQLDPIAYIRFASVYRQFVSLEEMLEELNRIALSPGVPPSEQPRLFDDEIADILNAAAEQEEADAGPGPEPLDPSLNGVEAEAREPIAIESARSGV
jgi:transcriptional repressor NrdR